MESKSRRLEQRQDESQTSLEASRLQPQVRQFSSVEEALREDRAQTPPPPALAQRVAEAIRQAGSPPRSWWSRWLGRKSGL